jgi:hypothetical protein
MVSSSKEKEGEKVMEEKEDGVDRNNPNAVAEYNYQLKKQKEAKENPITIKKEFTGKIADLFQGKIIREKSDGNLLVECPCCGSDGFNDYGGMVLFVETNTAYCFNSRTWFTLKETFALQKGIIKCIEGRQKNG